MECCMLTILMVIVIIIGPVRHKSSRRGRYHDRY